MGANLVAATSHDAGDIDAAVVVLRGAGGTLCHITRQPALLCFSAT